MYEWLLYAYPLKMATLDQCKTAVAKNKITTDQYQQITGQVYTAQ